MYEILTTALTDFALYSLFVLLYTLVGAYQNINIWGMKFDWKTYVNGLVKWLALGGVVVGSTVGAFLLLNQANAQGITIIDVQAIAPRVIFGVVIIASAVMLGKIITKLATALGVPAETLKAIQDASEATPEDEDLPVFFPDSTPKDVKAYVAEKLAQEKADAENENIEGGIGSIYSVPIDNYGTFKNAVLGRGYDIDNYYGWQCWDGTALLWQQLGLSLITGNGLAIGCWDLKRDVNKYDQFDLITDVNSLREGDVVVMRPNHIGFFDGYNGNYMRILGQNQGGSPTNPAGGSAFNLANVSKSAFAGAFRLRRWNVVTPPTPPTPVQPSKPVDDAVVADVMAGKYGNGAERKINLANAGYDPQAVQDAVNARINNQPAPTPPATPSTIQYVYRSGDTFGQVILNLGLNTANGLWGASGDVAYYTAQLHAQGIYGNIPVGSTITLVRRG